MGCRNWRQVAANFEIIAIGMLKEAYLVWAKLWFFNAYYIVVLNIPIQKVLVKYDSGARGEV